MEIALGWSFGSIATTGVVPIGQSNLVSHWIPPSPENFLRNSYEWIFEQWIDELGSPDYDRRRQVMFLMQSGDGLSLDLLHHCYPLVEEHEIRVRMREVGERIIYDRSLFRLGGFLGVGHRVIPLPDSLAGKGLGAMAVQINRVVPGTPAARADLQTDDLLVAVDGRNLSFPNSGEQAFSELISRSAPGTTVEFTVVRKEQIQKVSVLLGVRPPKYLNPENPAHLAALETARRDFVDWCATLEPY